MHRLTWAVWLTQRLACANSLSLDQTITSASSRALAGSYLAICSAVDGRVDEAMSQLQEAYDLLERHHVEADVEGRVATARVVILALLLGRTAEVVGPLAELSQRQGLSRSLYLQTLNNHAYFLVEIGRAEQSLALLHDAEGEADALGLSSLLSAIRVSTSDAHGALGNYVAAAGRHRSVTLDPRGQVVDRIAALMNASLWLRASGDAEGALHASEECLGLLSRSPQAVQEWLVMLEIAASLLVLGDVRAAKKRAMSVRRDAEAAQAAYHVLRADMILAEVARLEGDLPTAIEHLGQHREYILTESSNWQIGMYIRAFPSLLGVLASAIDPDDLPVHLLKLVLPEDSAEALLAARRSWTRTHGCGWHVAS